MGKSKWIKTDKFVTYCTQKQKMSQLLCSAPTNAAWEKTIASSCSQIQNVEVLAGYLQKTRALIFNGIEEERQKMTLHLYITYQLGSDCKLIILYEECKRTTAKKKKNSSKVSVCLLKYWQIMLHEMLVLQHSVQSFFWREREDKTRG